MHTPGPWETRGNTVIVTQGAMPLRIATLHDGATLTDDGRSTLSANAHLIAAAPDLLAALKALYSAYEYLSGNPPAQKELWDNAYQAIAKVENTSAS